MQRLLFITSTSLCSRDIISLNRKCALHTVETKCLKTRSCPEMSSLACHASFDPGIKQPCVQSIKNQFHKIFLVQMSKAKSTKYREGKKMGFIKMLFQKSWKAIWITQQWFRIFMLLAFVGFVLFCLINQCPATQKQAET